MKNIKCAICEQFFRTAIENMTVCQDCALEEEMNFMSDYWEDE